MVRLSPLERKIVLKVPSLFPDGDSEDLKIGKSSRDDISDAIQHLEGLGLVFGTHHQRTNSYTTYYRDLHLSVDGEQLRRDLDRCWIVRCFEKEWRWLISTISALGALALSLIDFFQLP